MVFAIIYIVGQMRELKKKLDAKVELDAINVRFVNEARERDQGRGFDIPPPPTRKVPPAPDADELAEAILRMRKTDKNFKKTNPPARFERPQPNMEWIESDDDIFGVNDANPSKHGKSSKNSKVTELDKPTPKNASASEKPLKTSKAYDSDGDVKMTPAHHKGPAKKIMPTKQIDFEGIHERLLRDGLDGIPVVVKVSERVMRHYHPNGEHITKDEANRLANGVCYYVDDDGTSHGRLRMRGAYCSVGTARAALSS